MNVLLHFYPGDAAAVLVANVAVQTTAVVLLALWGARLARNHPAARHALLLAALVCVVLSPVFSYLAYRADLVLFRIPALGEGAVGSADPVARTSVLAGQRSSAPARPEAPAETGGSIRISNAAQGELPVGPAARSAASLSPRSWAVADRLRAAGGALVAVWLAGVFWLSARLVRGLWFLFRLRRELRFVAPEEVRRSLERRPRYVGISRLPAIAISRRLSGPVTAGVFRPTVILPEQMFKRLKLEQLHDVLVHECAHVIRRDHLVSLLQRVVHILFWPHPLIASLNRELARAREEVCDNYVLSGGDGVDYARTLLEVGESLPRAGAVPAAVGLLPPRWNLEDRIAGFLNADRKLVTRLSIWKGAGMAAGLMLLAMAIAGTAQAAPEPAGGQRPEPTPSQPPTSAAESSAEVEADIETVQVHGRVLDPDGRPFEGATVYLVTYPWKPESAPQTVSGGEGQFQLGLSRSELEKVRENRRGGIIHLLATASGYGFCIEDLDAEAPDRPMTLRLAHDVPVRGRILNAERRPVAGATIEVQQILQTTTGRLDEYIEAVPDGQQWQYTTGHAGWGEPLPGMPDPIVADADGRFEISGIGAERVCWMHVAGPGIDDAQIRVMTRQTEPVKPYVQDTLYGTPIVRRPVYPHYGSTFEHVGSPARTIRGVVRDKATGRPVPGVRVVSGAKVDDHLQETDQQGRFEYTGCAKVAHYDLEVLPLRQPYFADRVRIEDTPGLEPIEVTVDLLRGTMAAGRVTDRESGEPVQGTVEYYPLFPNKHVDQLGERVNHPCSVSEVGPDGRYLLAVLPGPGVLGFEASYELEDRQYMSGLIDVKDLKRLLGDVEIEDPHDDYLRTAAGGTARGVMGQRKYQCLELISPDPQSALVTLDLACQRGRSVTGSLAGPDGEPIEGATVTGLYAKNVHRKTTLEGSTFVVQALNPRRTRSLLFYHPEKQLGTALELPGDQPGPLVVRLQPCGAVVGRVIDEQGRPAAGKMVVVTPERLVSTTSAWTGKTDVQGRFRIDGLVPGQKYQARLRDQSYLFAFQLSPRETKDLGTKKLRR